MVNKILKISFTLLIIMNLINCNQSEEEPTISYPKKLVYSEEGISTLEYWHGGELTNISPEKYINYFDANNCLNYFNDETDVYCKNTQITFENETDLILNYGETNINTSYKFVHDTLKIISNNQTLDLAIGNRNELKIYGSLYKFSNSTSSGCGGDEFLKFNFEGQFFLSKSSNHNIKFNNPSEMEANDEIVFYNKEYILR
ncbi:hypothetical protein [Tenacibaculum sp. UWU-22]|uniref:hypothetical protein n=1 Tax=Tenacibaculum sp. UWU-22 TaxID=3234187 RepID=UPI0034DADAC4